jgi:hypothetical protein
MKKFLGAWVVAGAMVAGTASAKTVAKVCDTDGTPGISKAEIGEKKCTKKLIRTLSLYERELAAWAASSAKDLIDTAVAAEAEKDPKKSKTEHRKALIGCATKTAGTAYNVWKTGDFKSIPESDAFQACFTLVLKSPKVAAAISARIEKRVQKVQAARADLEALLTEATGGSEAFQAALLLVEGKQTRQNAWALASREALQSGYVLGKAIQAKNPKDIILGALAFYGDVKTGAANIKEARGAACRAALLAEELEPSLFWKSGFVKRCEKAAISDPADI